MSLLKILALVILVGSIITFIVQLIKGGKKSALLFAASAVLSIGLFFLAGLVEEKVKASKSDDNATPIAQNDDAPSADAATETPNGTDFDFADNDDNDGSNANDQSNPNAAPEQAVDHTAETSPETAGDTVAANGATPDDSANAKTDTEQAAAGSNNDPTPTPAPAPEPLIENDPLAPTAIAGNNVDEVKIKEVIKFDGSKSKKKKASIKTWHWEFGDGTSADTAKADHAYAEAGNYNAVLTITDADGHKAQATRTINVNRPENKIRFITNRKVADATKVKSSPADLTGTITKTFSGSKINLEAEAQVEAADNCTCSITVSITGPGCNAVQTKKLSDGGEGKTSAKTACRGELGEYTWTIKRTNSGSCECTWEKFEIDGYEG